MVNRTPIFGGSPCTFLATFNKVVNLSETRGLRVKTNQKTLLLGTLQITE